MLRTDLPPASADTSATSKVASTGHRNGADATDDNEAVRSKPPKKARHAQPPAQRRRPTQPLPTDRIQFENQTKLLRGYAISSGPDGRGVTNVAVAKIVNLHPDTVQMSNSFFTGVGLLQRGDSGFVPAPEVIAFNRAHEWNPETAAYKLAPIMERAWFGQCLIPRLRITGTMEEREVLELLGAESNTPPQQKKQLELILDYLTAAGIIQRDGGVVRIMRQSAQSQPATAPPATSEAQEPGPQQDTRATATKGSPLAAALFPSSADGMVQFHISVRVNMSEFKDWQPERLSAFFSGIAQVLSARGKEELPGA